jgi:predicted GNAT superfamily acetyltransferase
MHKGWPWLPEKTLRGAINEAIEHFDDITRRPSSGAVWFRELKERFTPVAKELEKRYGDGDGVNRAIDQAVAAVRHDHAQSRS